LARGKFGIFSFEITYIRPVENVWVSDLKKLIKEILCNALVRFIVYSHKFWAGKRKKNVKN
jgi:hypothetical protein